MAANPDKQTTVGLHYLTGRFVTSWPLLVFFLFCKHTCTCMSSRRYVFLFCPVDDNLQPDVLSHILLNSQLKIHLLHVLIM